MNSVLTGQFAWRRRQATTVQRPSHQHKAHLFSGALEHLHITILHHLLMALLCHHKGTICRFHLNESITGWTTLRDGKVYSLNDQKESIFFG